MCSRVIEANRYHNPEQRFEVLAFQLESTLLRGPPSEWRWQSMKNDGTQHEYCLGNDPDSEVYRILAPSGTVVVKIYTNPDKYRNEVSNCRLINSFYSGAAPLVLATWPALGATAFEDVGDITPPVPTTDLHRDLWTNAVRQLAALHARGNIFFQLSKANHGQSLLIRQPPAVAKWVEPISIALSACTLRFNRAISSDIEHLLRSLIADLQQYQNNDTFGLGERSLSNIRMKGRRIVHIDLVKPPLNMPFPDLLPIFHCPYREDLITEYIQIRRSECPHFSQTAFYKADCEFVILESLRWIGIRSGQMQHPNFRFVSPNSCKSPIGTVQEKNRIHLVRIANSAEKLTETAPAIATVAFNFLKHFTIQ